MSSAQLELFNPVIERMIKTKIVKAEVKQEKGTQVNPIRSLRINPWNRFFRQNRNVVEPGRRINYKTLRRVAEKAWLINTIIRHQINKVRPFLVPSDNDQVRGFKIALKDAHRKPNEEEKKIIKYLQDFLMRTGEYDPEREDSLDDFVSKVLRDKYTLDQVTTEIQRKVNGKPFAFWSVDPATIFRVTEEGYNGNDKIRFIQEIDMKVTAVYTAEDLIFDYENPRSDIDFWGYGYSAVEQAIELIVSLINTFAYNAGVFTEDRLPRGAILIDGDLDIEDVEILEEYLIGIMSGSPASRYRIPIIPSGLGKDKSGGIQWISFQNSNREMEFSAWTEFLWTSTAALFDTDLEELGIRTKQSTSMLGENVAPRIELSKSRGLQANLAFLTQHINRIIEKVDSRFEIVFVGVEKDDVRLKNETREHELRTYKSINQIIKENDGTPVGFEWADVPGFLHQNVYQAWLQSKQATQMNVGIRQEDVDNNQEGDYVDMYREVILGGVGGDDEEIKKSIEIVV